MRRFVLALVAAGASLSTIETASAQGVLVFPRRATKSRVRYFSFDWRHVDILVGLDANTLDADRVGVEILTDPEKLRLPPLKSSTVAPDRSDPTDAQLPGQILPPDEDRLPLSATSTPSRTRFVSGLDPSETASIALELGPLTGGVRLFFYESEVQAAQRAAASIEDSYRYLVQKFRYIPERTFPYVLYNSYQEFLQTNLFPLQEGILGVTSTRGDLRLTLPYFGDFQFFRDVSVHEMAHQFTIQKTRSFAERADVRGDPLDRMPLWFIEGLAEFYAKAGLDNEAEMLVRDILLNPDVEQGYAMLDFWADRPGSTLWTYKVGQIRCVFLEETYGSGMIQRLIEKSPMMLGSSDDGERVEGFRGLIERLTGDDARIVAVKFEQWLKARAFKNYLEAKQGLADVEPIDDLDEYIDAINASPSGRVVMFRSYDLTIGQARLSLIDHRAPGDDATIVSDGGPGVESLHPISTRTFDLTDDRVVYLAEAGGGDVLYVQEYTHEAEQVITEPVHPEREDDVRQRRARYEDPPKPPKERWRARIRMGDRTRYNLRDYGIFAAYSPSFAPDGKRIAFIGLGPNGNRDLYVLTPQEDGEYSLQQYTDDPYAERDVAWGKSGVVFSSDATANRAHNLFIVDPDGNAKVERLTADPRDHFDPVVLTDGRIFFTSYENGSANVYEALKQGWVRRTDVVTGFFSLAPGPEGGLWALLHHSGRRTPVQLPGKMLTLADARPKEDDGGPAWTLPASPLDASVAYNPFAIRNWELGTIFGFLGAGPGGVFGQVLASANDRLNNHSLLLQLLIFGSLDLTDGYLVYLNQESRITWGFGPFQALSPRIDLTFDSRCSVQCGQPVGRLPLLSYERFFGVQGIARYPFNRYLYLQGRLEVGGANYVLDGPTRELLGDPTRNGTQVPGSTEPGRSLIQEWEELNGGMRFQTQAALSIGYDTIAYHRATGPIDGNGFLLEGKLATQPARGDTFGSVRLDAEQYFALFGRSNVFFRVGLGTTFGGVQPRQFYLSSFDTLRGVPFGRDDFLIGRAFFFSTTELQIPLNLLVRLLIFSDIEGIVGLDFGTVANDFRNFWDQRVLDFVLGFNFGLGPLVFRLHFAKPINIGAPLPNDDGSWVTNFSLSWLYF